MGWKSSDVVRFDLGPLLQGQTRIPKLKSAYNSLIIGPRGLQCQTNLGYKFALVLRCVGLVLSGLCPCSFWHLYIAK